jgi:hypothetical protein
MSVGEPRITGLTLKVLGALLSSRHIELSGAEISRATKLASGTLYPILYRSCWPAPAPGAARLTRLATAAGARRTGVYPRRPGALSRRRAQAII